jgi:beta-N-acetylhexosaminidase
VATSATILGLEGPILEAGEALFFQAAQPWGFILFARNIETPEQLRRLTSICGMPWAATRRS